MLQLGRNDYQRKYVVLWKISVCAENCHKMYYPLHFVLRKKIPRLHQLLEKYKGSPTVRAGCHLQRLNYHRTIVSLNACRLHLATARCRRNFRMTQFGTMFHLADFPFLSTNSQLLGMQVYAPRSEDAGCRLKKKGHIKV